VCRGPDPSWFQMAEQANAGSEVDKLALEKLAVHASETAWVGTAFDAVIDNNSTMDHLYTQVTHLVQDLQGATANLTT
jgi:hypothetical protein